MIFKEDFFFFFYTIGRRYSVPVTGIRTEKKIGPSRTLFARLRGPYRRNNNIHAHNHAQPKTVHTKWCIQYECGFLDVVARLIGFYFHLGSFFRLIFFFARDALVCRIGTVVFPVGRISVFSSSLRIPVKRYTIQCVVFVYSVCRKSTSVFTHTNRYV